jgi:integrase/recombinase XerD
MYIFFTGTESVKRFVPFLVNDQMLPVSAPNAWLREISQNGATASAHTLRSYGYHLLDFYSFLEARGIDWSCLTSESLVEYRDIQDENLSAHTAARLSRRTINARLSTVGRFYTFAVDQGLLRTNPITYKKIKIPRAANTSLHVQPPQTADVPTASFERLPRPEIKWKPHDQIMTWINSIEDWQDKLIAKLLYRLGLRREEIINLTIFDLPDRTSINPLLPEVHFPITGKGHKTRLVYMSMRDFNDLHDFIEIRRAKLVRCATAHDYIFVNKRGARLKTSYLNGMFRRVSKRCGIRLHPHMMRHSFSVFALDHWTTIGLSNPEKLLQARLGHASITTTQIYSHITDARRAKEAYGNASLIERLMSGEFSED